MNRQQEIEAIVTDVETRLADVVDAALQEISEVESDAWARRQRYHAARQELARAEQELSALREERAALPALHSQAVLDDDVTQELALKERAAEVREEIGELEDACTALRGELEDLIPPGRPRSQEIEGLVVEQHQSGRVTGTAFRARTDLESLRDRLQRTVDQALAPVITRHDEAGGETWNLGQQIAWREKAERESHSHPRQKARA